MTSIQVSSDSVDRGIDVSEAHGEHEKRTGQGDPDWPDWYADYMVRDQAGEELPS
jgi:hypothetical protein